MWRHDEANGARGAALHRAGLPGCARPCCGERRLARGAVGPKQAEAAVAERAQEPPSMYNSRRRAGGRGGSRGHRPPSLAALRRQHSSSTIASTSLNMRGRICDRKEILDHLLSACARARVTESAQRGVRVGRTSLSPGGCATEDAAALSGVTSASWTRGLTTR